MGKSSCVSRSGAVKLADTVGEERSINMGRCGKNEFEKRIQLL